MMCVTSQLFLAIILKLFHSPMTSSKPLLPPCTVSNSLDLLALSLSEAVHFPAGVEVIKEEGIYGYRFFPEAKILGVPASQIMVKCDYFPQEFSVVITFKREIPRNENEFVLTLIGPDRHTVLFGVSLQRSKIHVDFVRKDTEKRHTVSFEDQRMINGEWHTVTIAITRNNVKINLDCLHTHEKKLSEPFPRKLNTRGSRFHIASRRRARNRFTGMLRQVKLFPGADASLELCSANPNIDNGIFKPAKNAPGNAVHIDDVTDDASLTCDSDKRGMLMYRKESGNLEMCEGLKWMRLATSNERLDYVIDFKTLMTKSKTHDIEVFQIPGEGLFLASANQGRDRSMDSTIYKWHERRKTFVPYQNMSTDVARDWEYFSIENEHFLAVANHGSDENSIEAQSVIYRWDRRRRKFVALQYVRTFAARSWESFVIDGKHYLAVANHASQTGHKQKSWIYIWEPDHRGFVKFQPIDTIGGYDFEYFEIDNKHYLAVANSFDGVKTKMDSVLYQWRLSNFVPLQYFETYGATDWEYFAISGKHFIAVANYYDNSPERNTYAVDSYVFEYLPKSNQFTKIQDIQTHGALDIEFFTVGKDSYLIGSSSDDDDTDQLTSVIYRWQGMEHFVPVHNFSTSPCSDWEAFEADDGKHYLVSANVKSRESRILEMVTY